MGNQVRFRLVAPPGQFFANDRADASTTGLTTLGVLQIQETNSNKGIAPKTTVRQSEHQQKKNP